MFQEYVLAFARSDWGKPQGTLVKLGRPLGLNKVCQRIDIDFVFHLICSVVSLWDLQKHILACFNAETFCVGRKRDGTGVWEVVDAETLH